MSTTRRRRAQYPDLSVRAAEPCMCGADDCRRCRWLETDDDDDEAGDEARAEARNEQEEEESWTD